MTGVHIMSITTGPGLHNTNINPGEPSTFSLATLDYEVTLVQLSQ